MIFCPRGYTKIEGTCYRNKDAGVLDGSTDTVEREADERGDLESDTGATPPELDAESSGGSLDDAGVPAFDASDEVSPGNDGSTVESDAATPDAPVSDASPDSAATADAAVVDCSSQPCQNGGTCTDGPEGFACACAEPFVGSQCELEICPSTSIRSVADADAYRACAEIHGDLSVATAGLGEVRLPELVRVTGMVFMSAGNNASQSPLVRTVSLPKLEAVGGILIQGANPGALEEISLPALAEVTGNLHVVATETRTLRLPVLTAIGGSVNLMRLYKLCTLEMRRVSSVQGTLNLSDLYNLPASALGPLKEAQSGAPIEGKIGCCYQLDQIGCRDVTAAMRTMYCGC